MPPHPPQHGGRKPGGTPGKPAAKGKHGSGVRYWGAGNLRDFRGKERELRHGKSLIFEPVLGMVLGKENPLQIAICKGLISWCARRDSNARPLAPESIGLVFFVFL